MKRFHFAIDARLYGLQHTGIGRYVQNLIQELVKIDHFNHYTLITSNTKISSLPSNFSTINIPIRHYSLAEQIRLPLFLSRSNYDLIHFPHFNVPLFCPTPFIVTIHDLLWHEKIGFTATTLNPFKYLLKYLGYRMVISHAIRHSAHVITPTKHVSNAIANTFHLSPKKITTTYESADPIYQITVKSSKKILLKYHLNNPFVIYTGSLYPHKNVNSLIQALHQIPEIDLVVVSARNVFFDKTKAFVRQQKLLSRVKFLGFIPDSELIQIYQYALALIQPSQSEGFGLTGIEAMSCGLPVICSPNPVFQEVYQEAAYYTQNSSSSAIATAILNFQHDPAIKLRLIEKSNQVIHDYSWKKLAHQTLEIYQNTMESLS